MADSIRKLARRVMRLEREVRAGNTTPQLAYSSVEDGAIDVNIEGGTTMIVGQQYDGTSVAATVAGPNPPAPIVPFLNPSAGGLKIYWDGSFEDGAVAPMDFSRIAIHIVTDPLDLDPLNAAQRFGEIGSASGSEVFAVLPDVEHYVYLVCWTLPGKFTVGAPDFATPLPVATGEEGVKTYASATAPVGLGPADEGARWTDTDYGNLEHHWTGTEWQPLPVGPGATTGDVVAGKTVPLDSAMWLEWGVPNPAEAPTVRAQAIPYIKDAQTSGTVSGLHLDETRWVQMHSRRDYTATQSYALLWRAAYTDVTTKVVTYGPDLVIPDTTAPADGYKPVGVTRVDTRWYVLAQHVDFDAGNYVPSVYVFDDDWTYVTRWSLAASGEAYGITTDGTSVIAMVGAAPDTVEFLNATTGAVSSTVTLSGIDVTTSGPIAATVDLEFSAADFGGDRLILASSDSANLTTKVHVFSTAGVYQTTESFDMPGVIGTAGVEWDGSRFVASQPNGRMFKTSTQTAARTAWAAYTLYDSIGGAETSASPVAGPVTLGPRQALELFARVPDVDEAVAPDVVRPYVYVGPTQPTVGDTHLADVTTGLEADWWSVDVVDNVGATPPPTSTFPTGPSGQIAAEIGGFVVRGDSTGAWPFLERKVAAAAASTYAPLSHAHEDYEGQIGALDARVEAHEGQIGALDARVEALEEPPSTDTGWISDWAAKGGSIPFPNDASTVINHARYRIIGSVVTVEVSVSAGAAYNPGAADHGNQAVVSGLPVAARPVTNNVVAAAVMAHQPVGVLILPTGAITWAGSPRANPNFAAGDPMFITATYMI